MNHFYKQSLRIILGSILSICSIFSNAQTPKIQGQQARTAQIKAPQTPRATLQLPRTPLQTLHAPLQSQTAQIGTKDVRPGKILIKMKAGASFTTIQRRLPMLSANNRTETFQTGITRLDVVARQFKAIKMVRVFPNAGHMEARQHK